MPLEPIINASRITPHTAPFDLLGMCKISQIYSNRSCGKHLAQGICGAIVIQEIATVAGMAVCLYSWLPILQVLVGELLV